MRETIIMKSANFFSFFYTVEGEVAHGWHR